MSDTIGTEVSGVLGAFNLRTLVVTIDYRDGFVGFDFNPDRWGFPLVALRASPSRSSHFRTFTHSLLLLTRSLRGGPFFLLAPLPRSSQVPPGLFLSNVTVRVWPNARLRDSLGILVTSGFSSHPRPKGMSRVNERASHCM